MSSRDPVGKEGCQTFPRETRGPVVKADEVTHHAEAAIGRLDEFGQRYTIDFWLTTASGAATIRSGWIIRPTEDFPRLTTCYVLRD